MKQNFIFAIVLAVSSSLVADLEGQAKSATTRKLGTADHLSKPVTFRGKQFITVVPGGWVVSFPFKATRYQIAKLDNDGNNYKAIIRLDVGKPAADLSTTTKALCKRFDLEEKSANFDWAGQKAVLLVGKAIGIEKPQRVICTNRFGQLFMLFVAMDDDVEPEPELKYILEHWSWDDE